MGDEVNKLRPAPPRLVGRDRELAHLAAALHHRRARVLIDGEAGIGKSRLIREYLALPAAGEHRWLVATCPPFREPFTLGPVLDAVRAAVGDVGALGLSALGGVFRPLFPEWADRLPPPVEPLSDPSAARHRLFRALGELFDRLCLDLLVVEDAHWADEATQELLLFLATGSDISLVLTYRPEDLPAASALRRLSSRATTALRLSLQPLDVAGTAALMSSMLGDEHVSTEFAQFLHQHTDGLPLAVEECVRLMHARNDLARDGGSWVRRSLAEIEVPPTIRDAVLERVQRHDRDAQAVLTAAAVLAQPCSEALLGELAMLDTDRVRTGLVATVESGLLVQGAHGLVSFRHTLAGRAVYEAITAPARRALHLHAGRIMARQAPPPVAQLLQHFRQAGEVDRWFHYAEQVADLAVGAGDEATATTVLHDVVTNADLPAGLLLRAMQKIPSLPIVDMSGLRDLAGALNRALARPAIAQLAEGGLRSQLGRVLIQLEEYAAAAHELERAIPLLPGDSIEAARSMVLLGGILGAQVPRAAAVDWLRRAGPVLRHLPRHDALPLSVDRIHALLQLGVEEGWAEAAELERDWDEGERLQLTRLHASFGYSALVWGRYREASRHQAIGRELLAEAGQYDGLRALLASNQLRLDWLTGAWGDLHDRAVSMAADPDEHPSVLREANLIAGMLLAAAGRPEGERRLYGLLEQVRGYRTVEQFAEAAATLARLRLAEGAVQVAVDLTSEPALLLVEQEAWIWATEIAPVRVGALLAAGRAGEAADLVAAFVAGLGSCPAPAAQAALLVCQAMLKEGDGQYGVAAEEFCRAAAAWHELPRRYDELLAQERQATCLVAAGQAEAGVRILSDVFQGLAALGARCDAIRAMHVLRGWGVEVRRPWWGGRRSHGARLTPRELDAVRLLVAGQTNREIAQALFLSPKTVAGHLNSAMRKLDVTSRTALAVRAVQEGLITSSGDPKVQTGSSAG